jgi:hypothetical protein
MRSRRDGVKGWGVGCEEANFNPVLPLTLNVRKPVANSRNFLGKTAESSKTYLSYPQKSID